MASIRRRFRRRLSRPTRSSYRTRSYRGRFRRFSTRRSSYRPRRTYLRSRRYPRGYAGRTGYARVGRGSLSVSPAYSGGITARASGRSLAYRSPRNNLTEVSYKITDWAICPAAQFASSEASPIGWARGGLAADPAYASPLLFCSDYFANKWYPKGAIPGISRGTDFGERLGDDIYARYLRLRFDVQFLVAPTDLSPPCLFVYIYSSFPSAAYAGSTRLSSLPIDLVLRTDTDVPWSSPLSITSPRQPQTRVVRRVVIPYPGDFHSGVSARRDVSVEIIVPMNRRIAYDANNMPQTNFGLFAVLSSTNRLAPNLAAPCSLVRFDVDLNLSFSP